jgi:hypothetical protein
MRADTRRWRSVIATAAMSVVLGSTMGASAAAAQDAPADGVITSVVPSQAWTATGVMVTAGTDVAIRAEGSIHFGQPPIDLMAPAGLPWGPQCEAVAGAGAPWVVPGLDCYALIGRIGSGEPFVIGNGATIDAAADGELMLAANDDNFADNSGAWSATVSVPNASAAGTTAEAATTKGGLSLAMVALVGVLLLVVAVAALWVWRRITREPAFDLPKTLRAGQIDVRIARDRTLWRIDGGGEEHPFVPFAHDFAPIGLDGRRNSFTWRDLEFRAVGSGVRFGRPHGEVALQDEYVSASAGTTLGANGHTQGLVPLSLAEAWVFTLVSVDTAAEATNSSAHGHVTMFIREDEPFRPQADRIIASLRGFLEDLDRLLAEHQARRQSVGAM